DLEQKIADLVSKSYDLYRTAGDMHQAVAGIDALKEFDQKAMRIQGSPGGFGGGGGRGGRQGPRFAALNRSLGSLARVVDGQDAAPTPAMQSAYETGCRDLAEAVENWNALMKDQLSAVNAELSKQGRTTLKDQHLEAPPCR